jgi:hypothetical protein
MSIKIKTSKQLHIYDFFQCHTQKKEEVKKEEVKEEEREEVNDVKVRMNMEKMERK